jgi:pimeloyl-ACP methyl ester carboxylesterase
MEMRPRRFHVVIAATLLLLASGGCGGAVPPAPSTLTPSGSAPSSEPTITTTPKPTPRFRGTVTLADGRELAARCAGTGTPTVFLEGGGITPSLSDWPASLTNDLAAITTVCWYSRGGGEGSSTVPHPRAWADVLGDADQLLDALHEQAAVDGPYIFLGWSMGGSIALGEVMEDPSRVAALVILDTDFPVDFLVACPASGRSKAACQADYEADLEAQAIGADIAHTIVPIPGTPVRIFTAMQDPNCSDPAPGQTLTWGIAGVQLTATSCASMLIKVADKQAAEWGALSADFEQTRAQTSHDELPGFAHKGIANAIARLVAGVRGG